MLTPRAQKFTHRSIQILPKPQRVMVVYIPRDTPKDNSVLIDGIGNHVTVQYAVKYAIQQFCCNLLNITSKSVSERIPRNSKSQHCLIYEPSQRKGGFSPPPPPQHTHTLIHTPHSHSPPLSPILPVQIICSKHYIM